MTRTDVHRPSAIVPDDYEFVGFEHLKIDSPFDCWAIQAERARIQAHMGRTGGSYSHHAHGGNCMVCGNVMATYTVLFYHAKTNTYVRTGQDCADKLEMSYGDFNRFTAAVRNARDASAGKRKAQASLADAGLSDAWQYYAMDYEQLPDDESKPRFTYETVPVGPVDEENCAVSGAYREVRKPAGFHKLWEAETIRDIVGKLVKFGSISERQMEFVGNLLKQMADRPAKLAARAAEKAAAADCPTGRIKITGIVLKVEERESDWGTIDKMTVKAREGYIVWVTKPRSVQVDKGDEVEFTCTLTPSDTDPKFGFGKRPTF